MLASWPGKAGLKISVCIGTLATILILADQTFSQKLKESIEQVKRGETVSWETAKEKLGI